MSANEHFSLTTRIARPASEVFAWHERTGALERLCPPWERVEVVSSAGGIRKGARVTVRNKLGPLWQTWEVEHRDYVAGRQFRDIQISGPFKSWDHLHLVEPDGLDACRLTDEIHYRLPGGALGRLVGGGFVRRKLQQLFGWRHWRTKSDLESGVGLLAARPRTVLIAGGSGLIGGALIPFLQLQGHRVIRLVRRAPRGPDEVYWEPANGALDVKALAGVDGVINLSGENVGGGRWTQSRREAIFRSRVNATKTLVSAMQRMERKPEVFVSASAIGFYGERGDEVLNERSAIGQGFLAEVCLAWETHAEVAAKAGIRTALLRLGVVLSPAGGALAKLLPIFRAGAGGRIGDGAQWMSWISLDDVVGAFGSALADPNVQGVVNVVAPNPVTNRDFTRTLAVVLRRPAVIPVPRFGLRAVFGEMADGTILVSTRVQPDRLTSSGYRFQEPSLEPALRRMLGR
ncbi:MAG: TIGR01777 family oxidoreductase [Opitutus sp.]